MVHGAIENEPAVEAALESGERVLWHSHPGAGRLFLSVVPGLVRDFLFLLILGFSIYAGWPDATLAIRIVSAALGLFLVWSMVREVLEGTAARVSYYLITDRRLIMLTPRASGKRRDILPRFPQDVDERHRSCWLAETPERGAVANGRATIRVRIEAYVAKSESYPDMAYRTRVVRLYAVTESERAIELIAQLRRYNRQTLR